MLNLWLTKKVTAKKYLEGPTNEDFYVLKSRTQTFAARLHMTAIVGRAALTRAHAWTVPARAGKAACSAPSADSTL